MYIRTENDDGIEFRNYTDIQVKPGDDSSWNLVATNTLDRTELCIATFEKATDANKARLSLVKAQKNGNAWDAKEFKEGLNRKPMSVVATTTKSRL